MAFADTNLKVQRLQIIKLKRGGIMQLGIFRLRDRDEPDVVFLSPVQLEVKEPL